MVGWHHQLNGPGHRALARSSLLRDWFPCAGAVLSLAQTHRGRPHAALTPKLICTAKSLLKLRSIELVMPSNHLILCRPLLLPPSLFPYTTLFRSD